MGLLDRARSQRIRDHKTRNKPREESGTVKDDESVRPATARGRAYTSKRSDLPDLIQYKSAARPWTADEAERRKSRIEFPQTFDFKAGNDIFAFPMPSPRIATKTSMSSQERPPIPNAETSPCTALPRIGIAIGSPSQPPPPTFRRAMTTDDMRTKRRDQNLRGATPPSEHVDHTSARAQSNNSQSGWKKLGNLFRKPTKRVSSRKPEEQLRSGSDRLPVPAGLDKPLPDSPAPATSKVSSPGFDFNLDSSSGRHALPPSHRRSLARLEARAERDRANLATAVSVSNKSTLPTAGWSPNHPTSPASPPPLPVSGRSPYRSNPHTDNTVQHVFPPRSSSSMPQASFLDIEIPSIQLDRYSIMFEKFLEAKPTILERRQSKMHLLNANGRQHGPGKGELRPSLLAIVHTTGGNEGLRRSNTSPLPSPAMSTKSIAPEVPDRLAAPLAFHRPFPLRRSMTMAPSRKSPLQAHFGQDADASSGPPLCSPRLSFDMVVSNTTLGDGGDDAKNAAGSPMSFLVHRRRTTDVTFDSTLSSPSMTDSFSPFPTTRSPATPQLAWTEHPSQPGTPTESSPRHVQVAIAHKISVSRPRKKAQAVDTAEQPLPRPKVVEVGAQPAQTGKRAFLLTDGA